VCVSASEYVCASVCSGAETVPLVATPDGCASASGFVRLSACMCTCVRVRVCVHVYVCESAFMRACVQVYAVASRLFL